MSLRRREMAHEEKRSVVLINKRFQFALIARFVAVHAVILALFGVLIYLFVDSELEANLSSAHVTYRNLKHMIFPIVLTLSLLNILISAILIGLFVLYASHKIAGPLHRFKVVVDAIAGRDLGSVTQLREGDQLQETTSSLKALTQTLTGDVKDLRVRLAELRSCLSRGGMSDEVTSKLDALDELAARYVL